MDLRHKNRGIPEVVICVRKVESPPNEIRGIGSLQALAPSCIAALALVVSGIVGAGNYGLQKRSIDLTDHIASLERASRQNEYELAKQREERLLQIDAFKFAVEHADALLDPDAHKRSVVTKLFLANFPPATVIQNLNAISQQPAEKTAADELRDAQQQLPAGAFVFNYRKDGIQAKKCAEILRDRGIKTVAIESSSHIASGPVELHYFETIDQSSAERLAGWLSASGCVTEVRADFEPAQFPPRWHSFNLLVPEASG